MQASFLSIYLMPMAIAIIMVGLGLSLTPADFKRIFEYPKAVLIGLITQMLLLPAICLFIADFFQLEPALAVGLMLLAAAPGGPSANLYSHMAGGDVALNVSLTALNSVLSIFSIAGIVNFSLAYFMQAEAYVPMQFQKVLEVCAMIITPISLGMWIRHRYPGFAQRMEGKVKLISGLFLALLIVLAGLNEIDHLVHDIKAVGAAALSFNLACLLVGYFLPRLFKLPPKQAVAISMEVGIHNGSLAIYIALSILNNGAMTIPAVVYSLIMFITAAVFAFWSQKKLAN
ncbi:bile acid:sodium symporter family protein [Aquirufa sp. TARAVU-A1A]